MKLHLFNPENDLALGLGCRNYTPPPHAAAIHNAGALLPMWWAEADDLILAPAALADEAGRLASRYGLNGRIGETAGVTEALPWGWSLDAKRQFRRAGVSDTVLPADEVVNRMRDLSHRRTSIEIIRSLDGDYPLPVEATDAGTVVRLENENPGCFIKSPWSGSGRGVFCARSLDAEALKRRAEGIIHRQGSVMVERGLDKMTDFAALFYSDGHRVEFRGLSVFATEARGMYSGNVVAPQSMLWARLGEEIDTSLLRSIIEREEVILSRIIGNSYRGWMGIDMMTYREKGKIKIMPCVELNLRMTMGVVAMIVAGRLNVEGQHFLAWEHNTTTAPVEGEGKGLVLLPPTDGFTLRLT